MDINVLLNLQAQPGIINQAFQIVGRCNKEHPLDMSKRPSCTYYLN